MKQQVVILTIDNKPVKVVAVKDDLSKVRVGTYTFTGLENWSYNVNGSRWICHMSNDGKVPPSSADKNLNFMTNVIVPVEKKYNTYDTDGWFVYGYNNELYVQFRENTNYPQGTSPANLFKNGTILYFELATQTDQTASTYPSVVACEKGGSLEVEYDNTDNTPSDFTFNYSVYKPIE